MDLFLKVGPLFSRYGLFRNLCNPRNRFSYYYKGFTTLSYLNLIPDSEKTNSLSNLDLNDCLKSGRCEIFSRFVENYRTTVHNLNYKIENVESYFKSSSDPSNALEYEVIGSYAYYLKAFNGSVSLCRTLMTGSKRPRRELDLEEFILRNGKALVDFSELSKEGIVNVKKLRISPKGDFIIVQYDPDFSDSHKARFYSISKGRLFDAVLEDVGEVYMMSHPPKHRLTRLYYTQLNSNRRSCKLITSLIHNSTGRVCSKKVVYNEPVHYISLYKSKNGKALFMATTSYNKVFSTFLIRNKGKMYLIPATNDVKTLLEYRNHIVYRIYSNMVSQISMISSRHLKPYSLRFRNRTIDKKHEYDSIKIRYVVTDIDMFNKGLVLYLMKPPSTPRVAILPFGKSRSRQGYKLIDDVTDGEGVAGANVQKDGKSDETGNEDKRIKIREMPSHKAGIIEPATNMNYYSDSVKFNINSPGSSEARMEIDLETLELKKASGSDDGIASFVIDVPSKDGSCKIPVTIVAKGGVNEVGDIARKKCMLYVYGFYGENLKVCNYIEHHPMLEMEYILCFAHVRGGGELGKEWHNMGAKEKKHNSFYDLVDVIKYLIGKNITTSSRLVLNVSSASGVLGGCVYNMSPQLCSVIVFKLPYLDLLTTVTDETNALVELEYEEFGNTSEDRQMLESVYSLDPCSNVRSVKTQKPALIINCDERDIRAPWYHTAKFVTLLSQNHENENILVKVSNYGHDGCPPDVYLIRTCSEYISIIDHIVAKNTRNGI
ncbi:oligopeptidase B [Theileria orientalis]|uniref:Prolyl endopeptidase n=1 Tax=Theileria orientalis TaxID=68886 RepID=A0A976M8C3_THEOR|nr:oligopeptidase B [Theileria orientalis]